MTAETAPPAEYVDHYTEAQAELSAAYVARSMLAATFEDAHAQAAQGRMVDAALELKIQELSLAAAHTLAAAEVHSRLAQVQAIQGEAGL